MQAHQVDWFLKKITGAVLEKTASQILGGVPGDNDDLDVGLDLVNEPQCLGAVHLRHGNVEEHGIGQVFLDPEQGFLSVARGVHDIAKAGEELVDGREKVALVVNKQKRELVWAGHLEVASSSGDDCSGQVFTRVRGQYTGACYPGKDQDSCGVCPLHPIT